MECRLAQDREGQPVARGLLHDIDLLFGERHGDVYRRSTVDFLFLSGLTTQSLTSLGRAKEKWPPDA